MKKSVLFVCIHNSARSQMAEAFVNQLCSNTYEAESAGIEPGSLNPTVVQVMKEIDIDLSGNRTKCVSDILESGKRFNYIITVCDAASAERCPTFAGDGIRLHWGFPDPSALIGVDRLEQTRKIRDDIANQVKAWCLENCKE